MLLSLTWRPLSSPASNFARPAGHLLPADSAGFIKGESYRVAESLCGFPLLWGWTWILPEPASACPPCSQLPLPCITHSFPSAGLPAFAQLCPGLEHPSQLLLLRLCL